MPDVSGFVRGVWGLAASAEDPFEFFEVDPVGGVPDGAFVFYSNELR